MKIVLIGVMGAGKSTVGKMLSQQLKLQLVEIDLEILRLSRRRSIADIFDFDGEASYRELESRCAVSLRSAQSCVVSTGGGVIPDPANMRG